MKIKSWWWKILGITLVIYTLTVGMLTPLKPGIVGVSPNKLYTGESNLLRINGYNQNFDMAEENQAYLRIKDSVFIRNVSSEVIDHNTIIFSFDIPSSLLEDDSIIVASVNIDNEIDGYSVLPNAVFIYQSSDSIFVEGELLSKPVNIHDPGKFRFPYRSILNETIRNTFFHVTIWFSMFILLIAGLYMAIKYLITKDLDYDHKSKSLTIVAILYGTLGLVTGSIWAKYTWGTWWTTDVKLNMAAVAMLIYLAYLVLRGSIKDQDREARLASAYNIFAFVALIPLVFVIPRLTDSLHPGSGGNPALGGEDLDHTLRMVFYPSIIGMTLLGLWMATLYYRLVKIKEKILLGD